MVEVLVGDRDAVQIIHIVPGALSSDQNSCAGLRESRSTSPSRRFENIVAKQSQIHELPSVQRKILDTLVGDDLANLRIRSSQQRVGFPNRNEVCSVPDFQRRRLAGAGGI